MNTKRFTSIALGTLMLAAPAYLAAQQDQDQGQQESVADAARKAQAEKKNAPKPKMTIDNDNLGTLTGTINVVGQEPAPADQAKKDSAAPGEAATKKGEAYFRDKFSAANKKLADDQRDLDVTQREYNLKQEQFYTNPMASLKEDYSRQDLNDTKTKIDELTAKVTQDKADIAGLEDELRQAGGDPGWETQPPQPSSAASGSTSASTDSDAAQPPSSPAPATSPQP